MTVPPTIHLFVICSDDSQGDPSLTSLCRVAVKYRSVVPDRAKLIGMPRIQNVGESAPRGQLL